MKTFSLSPTNKPSARSRFFSGARTFLIGVLLFAGFWNEVRADFIPPAAGDVVVDGAFTSPQEYARAFKVRDDWNVGWFYNQYKTNWHSTGTITIFKLHAFDDLAYGDSNGTNSVNTFEFQWSNTLVKAWVFIAGRFPTNDADWLSEWGLTNYTSLDGDVGFIVRLNGDPGTDRQWKAGGPQPGDADWNFTNYYGVFAYGGFNNSGFTNGYNNIPDPREDYEWSLTMNCLQGGGGGGVMGVPPGDDNPIPPGICTPIWTNIPIYKLVQDVKPWEVMPGWIATRIPSKWWVPTGLFKRTQMGWDSSMHPFFPWIFCPQDEGGPIYEVDPTSTNKNFITCGVRTTYQDGAYAIFHNRTNETTILNIVGTLAPNLFAFNHNTNGYTLTGGGLDGDCLLRKQGSGSLNISNSNYHSCSDLSGGTVTISTSSAFGTGTVYLATVSLESANAAALTIGNPLVLSGDITLGSGLTFNGAYVRLGSGGSTITVPTNGLATISNVVTGIGFFIKDGGGTLRSAAVNTYTGMTAVVNGTLALIGPGSISKSAWIGVLDGTLDVTGRTDGTLTVASGQILWGDGTVLGNVIVDTGGALSPGSWTNFGPLNVSGGVTDNAGSTNFFRLDPLHGTNDGLSATSITYNGTLCLTNISATPLAAGNSFKLFHAANYAGAFSTITPATPGAGLGWNTSQLKVSGTLGVVLRPSLTITFTNGICVLTWAGGGLLEATNVLGPWKTNNAVSPYMFSPTGYQKFYRVFTNASP